MSNATEIINAFSVDVEGFIESNLESFHVGEKYLEPKRENYNIEKNLNILLELLGAYDVKATFFFLGRIAKDLPHTVKEVSRAGHEIACHSFEHRRIFGTEKDVFKKEVYSAKRRLEDVSGKKVYGFRAPEFSITKSSIWALDILKEVGFVYDSSIYPISLHNVYGIAESQKFIHNLPNGLIEFPLSTIDIFKVRLPFGGGGYFRLYPVFITKFCMSGINRLGHPCMFYIHPYEVAAVEPKISGLSFYRKFRHYYNCENGNDRLKGILERFKFAPAIEVINLSNVLTASK